MNGEAIFAKGSNYIPLHILPELSAEPSRLRHLLTSTRDANMNMLRVWGGGLYESDLFYEVIKNSIHVFVTFWPNKCLRCWPDTLQKGFLSFVVE